MAIFGFPETAGEWDGRHYLRLVVIVCAYVVLRPIVQAIMHKMGEKKRLEEKRLYEEEQIRKNKQHRMRERLGVEVDPTEDDQPKELAANTNPAAESSATRKSVSSILRKRKQPETKQEKLQSIVDDMPSDEDVSDLIG